MRGRIAVFVLVIAVIGGVALLIDRDDTPWQPAERCSAHVLTYAASLDVEQARNASLMAAIGVRRGLPARAVSIAIATAMQESKLRNLNHGDRDSLGLFQQRPSQGWGTRRQVRNPYYAINAFYDVLAKVQGFGSMKITEAAQSVQRSAYPGAYAAHEYEARALASALTGYSPAKFTCVIRSADGDGSYAHVVHNLQRAYGWLNTSPDARGNLRIGLGSSATDRRLGWSIAQYAVAHSSVLGIKDVRFDGRVWTMGEKSQRGWRQAPRSRAPGDSVRIGLG